MSKLGKHNGRYILVDHAPVPEPSLLAWGAWMEKRSNRRVASTHIGDTHVSTIFLGVDYAFEDDSLPVLFETVAISKRGNTEDAHMRRYHTWDEAIAGHAEVVAIVEADYKRTAH